ncbi:MAG: DMT family transporter [Gemmobacter sp.]
MIPETFRYAAVMIAAGVGIPVLAALNAQLGARLASPAAAAAVLFVVAFSGAVAVMLATSGPGPLRALPDQPRHLFLAGLIIAFYLLSITWIAPRFGVGNAIFSVLLGQMLAAAVIDHFGLLGAMAKPLTLSRGGGIALMAAGVFLIQRN